MLRRLLSFSGATLAVLAFAGFSGHHQVTATVTPETSAWDQPIDIRVTGLAAGQAVTLAMQSVDAHGVAFSSSAPFRADRSGTVDLARTSPLPTPDGSDYTTVRRMGLFDRMRPTAREIARYQWTEKPRVFHVTVSAGGRTIAATTFRRGFGYPTPIVDRAVTVAHDGIVGTYAAPAHPRRGPAVLIFGGSEGGPGHPLDAMRFASDGVPTLALGYFDAPGVPRELKDVPLEYFRRALEWLDRRRGVDPKQVSVIGESRGGEAALLLGVHYPSLVRGVVSLVGSDYVVCGIRGADHPGCIGPAWTLDGKAIPYFRPGMANTAARITAARIPVARIHGPVLFSCALQDEVWDSCAFARDAEAELNAARFPYPHPLYAYPNAGHSGAQTNVYEPGEQLNDTLLPDDELAREALWPKLLDFVRRI